MDAAPGGAGSTSAAPALARLTAPVHWRCIEFASDIHLHPSMPRTFAAFCRWLDESAADALFILGDLFEVWVGDDALDADPFARECADALQRASRRRPLHLMHGNRDFLLGARFAHHTGAQVLGDPCVLEFGDRRWLLTHGDALCTDDAGYVAFRAQVRSAQWQRDFLAKPLSGRQRLAASMREQSRMHQAQRNRLSDVDPREVDAWLARARAPVMIHGHTHQPADHRLDDDHTRLVLSDWDCDGETNDDRWPADAPVRAQVLRVSPQGWRRVSVA